MNKPYVYEADDGSLVIEFIKKDRRFYISFEKDDLKESSWGYVKRGSNGMTYELLPDKMIACFGDFLLDA